MSEKNDNDTNYKELTGPEGMEKIASLVKGHSHCHAEHRRPRWNHQLSTHGNSG